MAIEITVEQLEQQDERVEVGFESQGACKVIVTGVEGLGVIMDLNNNGKPFAIEKSFTLDSGDPMEVIEFVGVVSLTPNNPLRSGQKITIIRFTEVQP